MASKPESGPGSQGRANIKYLEAHGPTAVKELPTNVSYDDKIAGVWVFKLNGAGSNGGARTGTGGQILAVAWLPEDHTKEQVLRAFLDANPHLVEAKTRNGLVRMLRGHGRQWHDAIDAVLDDYYDDD